ncbi:MAG: alpha/beta fold hydrolase [Christensenellales bacterium]|jgi:alpha-beta hydrolase superfamily lysophospholipase
MEPAVKSISYPSATGLGDIYAEIYAPAEPPWALLQIAHGMAEHIGRYADFAGALAASGVLVAMNDHMGHGKSIPEGGHKGFFGDAGGAKNVVADMKALRDRVAEAYPGVPFALMGHSMGSFFSRAYAAKFTEDIDALILSGTAGKNPVIGLGKLLARRERRRHPRTPSALLHRMSFGAYNRAFAPSRTENDWLSADEAQVDKYAADPLCGYAFTAEAMLDVFDTLSSISGRKWAQSVPDIPVYIFSGAKDPVGAAGKGVRQVAAWLSDTGHRVRLKLYPEGRHEMLNEVNRPDVYAGILDFLKEAFPQP